MIDLEDFIKQHIINRSESFFKEDLENNYAQLSEQINDKSVLVIGGAGTIGSSYIKALLHFKPHRLYVIDTNENGLTELTRDLRSSSGLHIPRDYKTYPVNFGDQIFYRILNREGPFDIVANFAAHKHVRSEKDHYSIEAMLQNNVIFTKNLLDWLLESDVAHLFCVSTDKAANPINVMGASKKLMEETLLAYSEQIPITTARFANVAFSNGSLLAGFLERVMKKQPLSAPNDVKRYFVSPQESGQICLIASILGNSGEILFPRLLPDSMQTFSEIAIDFIAELGYSPDYCPTEHEARQAALNWHPGSSSYPVYFFKSNTSGEKLFEEFFTDKEKVDFDRFSSLGVIQGRSKKSISDINKFVDELQAIVADRENNKEIIVKFLGDFLPGFTHHETGFSLDEKM